jgi:hypothetical protein
MEKAETRFLRTVAGCTFLGQKQNIGICTELEMFNLTERIEKQKENWYEYISRMTRQQIDIQKYY